MKSEELAKILNILSDFLRLYPGKDIEFILKDLKRLKENDIQKNEIQKSDKVPEKNSTDEDQKKRIDEFIRDIDSLNMSQIDEKLNSEDLFPNMAFVRYFAKKLGIELTSRQSRANSIHTVKSHIDRMRIDRTISKRDE